MVQKVKRSVLLFIVFFATVVFTDCVSPRIEVSNDSSVDAFIGGDVLIVDDVGIADSCIPKTYEQLAQEFCDLDEDICAFCDVTDGCGKKSEYSSDCDDSANGLSCSDHKCMCISGSPLCGGLNCCEEGFVCQQGQCVSECESNFIYCNGICIDPMKDINNCGQCNNACYSSHGLTCSSGKCACPSGFVECSGMCIDLNTSINNCGACGNKCPTWKCESTNVGSCVGGVCSSPCPASLCLCGSTCVDFQIDNNNCGACGKVCDIADGQYCSFGKCACPIGLTNCSGSCVNLLTDNNNCGTCGTACTQSCCLAGGCGNGVTASIDVQGNTTAYVGQILQYKAFLHYVNGSVSEVTKNTNLTWTAHNDSSALCSITAATISNLSTPVDTKGLATFHGAGCRAIITGTYSIGFCNSYSDSISVDISAAP